MTVVQLKKQFRKMSTCAALTVMVQKGCAGKYFSWYGEHYTPADALKIWPGAILDAQCHLCKVVFFGGPPENGHWYEGTVLSMLCDTILFDWATKDLPLETKLAI